MFIIVSKEKEGFRRAGLAHPAGATEYEDGQLSEEQLEILNGDPSFQIKAGAPKKKAIVSSDDKTANTFAALIMESNVQYTPEEMDVIAKAIEEADPIIGHIHNAIGALDVAKDFDSKDTPKVGAVEAQLKGSVDPKEINKEVVMKAWELVPDKAKELITKK